MTHYMYRFIFKENKTTSEQLIGNENQTILQVFKINHNEFTQLSKILFTLRAFQVPKTLFGTTCQRRMRDVIGRCTIIRQCALAIGENFTY